MQHPKRMALRQQAVVAEPEIAEPKAKPKTTTRKPRVTRKPRTKK